MDVFEKKNGCFPLFFFSKEKLVRTSIIIEIIAIRSPATFTLVPKQQRQHQYGDRRSLLRWKVETARNSPKFKSTLSLSRSQIFLFLLTKREVLNLIALLLVLAINFLFGGFFTLFHCPIPVSMGKTSWHQRDFKGCLWISSLTHYCCILATARPWRSSKSWSIFSEDDLGTQFTCFTGKKSTKDYKYCHRRRC
jgi:hypothetical protein